MAEAHIPRIIHPRRRGRPTGPTPLFVEDCVRFEATDLLAKSRGAPDAGGRMHGCTLTWTEFGRQRVRSVLLPVTSTRQPLGGARRWWRCPSCGRRSGVLLAREPAGPIACRRCLRAQHVGDYPTRHRNRRLAALLRGFFVDGSLSLNDTTERELNALLTKRRRGIRRGRRVLYRAARALVKVRAWPETLAELFDAVTRA